MIKQILYFFIFFSIAFSSLGQKVVNGIVLDDESLPFPGVNIIELSTDSATISDINGHFSILIPTDTSCLKLSFVGYNDTTVCNLSDTILSVYLTSDIVALSDGIICCTCPIYR